MLKYTFRPFYLGDAEDASEVHDQALLLDDGERRWPLDDAGDADAGGDALLLDESKASVR